MLNRLPKRLRRPLKVLLWFVLLLFAFLLFERWRGQISLASYKRELAAKGETLDFHKLLAPPVPDATNGASELLRLESLLRDGKAVPTNFPLRMKYIAPGKALVGYRESFWVNERVTNNWDMVALDIATNQLTLNELRAVLKRPGFDFKLDHTQGAGLRVPGLLATKSICLWFGFASQNCLHIGDNQRALENLLAAIATCRVVANDHITISELVRMAISRINLGTTWELLQAEGWSDEQLASLQQAWEQNSYTTNMICSLRMERADGENYFEPFRNSNDETYKYMFPAWLASLTEDSESGPPSWWQCEFLRRQVYCQLWRFAWLDQDEKYFLESLQQLIDGHGTGAEKSAKPPEEYWFGLAKAPAMNFYDRLRFGMSAQSVASFAHAVRKSLCAETDRSMILSAIALKRYLLRHGSPAQNLNALVPDVLPSVPLDYMDGKPMKYRANTNGTFLLYSVGYDGIDDGGDASPTDAEMKYRGIWSGRDAVWPMPATPEEIEAWRKESAKN